MKRPGGQPKGSAPRWSFMKHLAAALIAFALSPTFALAQGTSGSSGGTSGSSPGGTSTAPTSPGVGTPGAPAVSPTAPGVPNSGSNLQVPNPAVQNPTSDPQRNNVDVNPPQRNLPAVSPSTSAPPNTIGTPSSPGTTPRPYEKPTPGGANSSPNSAPGSVRAGQNKTFDGVADCVRLWDKGTHMTTAEWRAACVRVQTRLQAVDKEQSSARATRRKAAEVK